MAEGKHICSTVSKVERGSLSLSLSLSLATTSIITIGTLLVAYACPPPYRVVLGGARVRMPKRLRAAATGAPKPSHGSEAAREPKAPSTAPAWFEALYSGAMSDEYKRYMSEEWAHEKRGDVPLFWLVLQAVLPFAPVLHLEKNDLFDPKAMPLLHALRWLPTPVYRMFGVCHIPMVKRLLTTLCRAAFFILFSYIALLKPCGPLHTVHYVGAIWTCSLASARPRHNERVAHAASRQLEFESRPWLNS